VIQAGGTMLPVEVKAGTKGQMQSIRLFMAERKLSKGIRVSLENFGTLGDIDILPLYGIRHLCCQAAGLMVVVGLTEQG